MADIRKTWFSNLTKEEVVRANGLLDTVFEGGAIAGGLTFSELILVSDAKKEFKQITGLEAKDVLSAFCEEGYCFGNDFIPESYFEN